MTPPDVNRRELLELAAVTGAAMVGGQIMPGSIQETTPLRFPYRVSDTESESLLILAHSSGYVEWTAHLEWSNGEDSGALTIDDKGKPFRTTSFIEGREIIHPDGAGGWRE